MKIRILLLSFIIAAALCLGNGSIPTRAEASEQTPEPENPYFQSTTFTSANGDSLEADTINGPSTPPEEIQALMSSDEASSPSLTDATSVILDVPAYTWVFGCSAVSGAMIAGYYDQNDYDNIYTGSTNNGVMPDTNSSWSTWTDSDGDTYPNNPLIASHRGIDGLTGKGSIDDYWLYVNSETDDPYITAGRTQHSWVSAIGDYMKTSQSAYDNADGATTFYNYTSSAEQLTCDVLEDNDLQDVDGTYGRKLFYEARGYTVGDCYNQKTSNNSGNFTLTDYKAEIDAGYPVMINLNGHTIVGVGYSTSSSTIYIHDTWYTTTTSMTWGGSYGGMKMLSVSIVHPEWVDIATNVQADDDSTSGKVCVTWDSSSSSTHLVSRSTSETGEKTKLNASSLASTSYCDSTARPGVQYYYFVQTCSGSSCGVYSTPDEGSIEGHQIFNSLVTGE